jgi:hypothetical protein
MKNIHLLPTDKSTRLFTSDSELILAGYPKTTFKTGKNIYITSDEKPKLNDWFLDTLDKVVFKVTYEDILTTQLDGLPFNFKKIILTTDQELIKDGVQAIDDEFLEWFVKNPSCERVEIEDFPMTEKYNPKGDYIHRSYWGYKIIIPKEEAKQETENLKNFKKLVSDEISPAMKGFIKEKQEDKKMYSEEDMKLAFETGRNFQLTGENNFNELIEQFKNK